MKTNRIRFFYILNLLPVIGLVVFYYTRYLEGTYSFLIPLGLSFLWLLLTMVSGKAKGLLFNNISAWWMVYLFLCAIMVIIGFSSTNLNFIISRLPIYLIPVMGYFMIRHYNIREKGLFLVLFFIVFLANLIYNIFLGFQLPDVFEEQASTEESIDFSILMNIASSSFISVCYWLIGVLGGILLSIKKKNISFLCLLMIVPTAYYMLFQNTRGTAILLLMIEIAGIVLAFFEPTKQKDRKPYYVFSTVALMLLVLMVFVPFMGWLMEHLQSERLAERLNDLVDFRISGGNVNSVKEGSFTERILLAQTSLSSFFSSPLSILIGIGDHTQAFGGDLIKSGIGGHSEFIDVLARYGLVGAFIFWNIMRRFYRLLRKQTSNREIVKYVNIVFFIIILTGFLNNIFQPNMLLFLYLVFPVMIELTDNIIKRSNGK